MRSLVSRKPTGGNLVLVSHGSTILALTGVSPATGEMVVVTPQGNGKFHVAGRLEVAAALSPPHCQSVLTEAAAAGTPTSGRP